MASDILNDECTGRSPCLTCEHRDMDKNKCSLLCLRLAAYNSGESWQGKPLPYIKEGSKMEDKSQRSEVGSQQATQSSAAPGRSKTEKREYHKTTIQPGPVKQARGLLNKEAGGICLIDGCDIKDRLIRGLCPKHYQAWRKGCIKHPILGEFTVWQAKSRKSDLPAQKSEVRKDVERGNQASQKATPVKEKKRMSKDSKASYYDAGGIETLDIIKAKLTPEQYKGYLLGCSLKYQCRLMHKFGDKDRIRDAEKAANYILWLVEAFKD